MEFNFDFSKLPSDVALALSQQQYTHDLTLDLAKCMSLSEIDRDLLHQEIVGAVADVVDRHLDYATRPRA